MSSHTRPESLIGQEAGPGDSQAAIMVKWSFCGALLGFLILHPAIMILGSLMRQPTPFAWSTLVQVCREEFLRSFTPAMLPWTLGFTGVGMLAGALYGKMRHLYAALGQREELFRLITTSARDAILLLDEQGRIRFANPAAGSILGCDPAELLFCEAREVIELPEPPSGSGGHPYSDAASVSFAPAGPFRTLASRGDGSRIPVEATVGVVEPERDWLAVAVLRDISEHERLERLRRDTERIVRHDLKGPLNTISGYSRILLREDAASDPREAAEAIQQQTERMLHMIDHSLDLFRIEEGTYQLRPEWLDLEPVLYRLAEEQGALKRTRNLRVEVEVDCGSEGEPGCLLRGEPHHIESIVYNLLQNALEASPEGETVALCAKRRGDRVLILIRSSGQIPQQIRDCFFEPYVTQGKPGGTGLGTYSAKLLVRAHKGDIDFESSQQEGTLVWVELPIDPHKAK